MTKTSNGQHLGNDGTKDSDDELILMDFDALGEVIFRGQASVTNGEFAFEFIVPTRHHRGRRQWENKFIL